MLHKSGDFSVVEKAAIPHTHTYCFCLLAELATASAASTYCMPLRLILFKIEKQISTRAHPEMVDDELVHAEDIGY